MGTFLEKNGRLLHQNLSFDLLPKYYSNKQSEIVCVKLWNGRIRSALVEFRGFSRLVFLAIFRFLHFGLLLLFFFYFSFSCSTLADRMRPFHTFTVINSDCFSD